MSKFIKAFIFDMDGVIIDSERAWTPYQKKFSSNLLGKRIYKKIYKNPGSTVGLSVDAIYQKAVKYGFSMDLKKYYQIYDEQAELIYTSATATPNIDHLIKFLRSRDFKIGLISTSRSKWIKLALKKLNFKKNDFDYILSLNDRKDLKPKPYPDGYIETMKVLGTTPKSTIILEDSNSGIKSAKASGAFTIGFKENLLPGYLQTGADFYAENIFGVIMIVNKLMHSLKKYRKDNLIFS